MKTFNCSLVVGLALLAAGCAEINVTKVTRSNDEKTKGIRYALPKPILQVSPRPDGTVAVDVVYLPDLNNTYAVDTWGWLSSSTFQVTLDSGGLLSAIEFKQNTSAVGQQVATSAGAGAAQLYNLQAQQNVANQTALNTAQSNVATAKSAADAARAQLGSDTNVLSGTTASLAALNANAASSSNAIAAAQAAVTAAQTAVNMDSGLLAQALAKYQDAQQTLGQTQTTAQAVAFSATPGAAITPTVPTPGTTGFGPQTWTTPPGYDLPENHGAILYAINESVSPTGEPMVKLTAAKWRADGKPQEDFSTTDLALGPPFLGPQNMRYSLTATNAYFFFDRPIESIFSSAVATAAIAAPAAPATIVTAAQAATLDSTNKTTVTLPLSLTTPPGGALKPGNYQFSLIFTWGGGHQQPVTVPFTVTSP
jgi:hypothetical protein